QALRVEPLLPSTMGRRLALAALGFLAVLAVAVNALAEGNVQVRGLIDMVAGDDRDYRNYNTFNTNDTNFDGLRARLFVEGNRGNTSVYLQFLVSPESYSVYRFYGGYRVRSHSATRTVMLCTDARSSQVW